MFGLITKYPKSFAAAIALHIVVGIIFAVNFEFSSDEPIQPEVDVVQATAVNEEQVLAELAALKAAEAKKRKAEQDRLKKLDKEADRARQKRLNEQKRLKELEKKRKTEQAKKKKLEKERKLAEKKKKEAEKRQRVAEKKRKDAEKKQKEAEKKRRIADEERRVAEKRRVKELEKQRVAEEQRKKAEAERARAEEIERKAKEKALRAIEEQQRIDDAKARQAELAAEERRLAASHNKKAQKIVNRYKLLIQKQVKNNWRMRNVKPGSHCDVFVRMMPTGDVLAVNAKNCVGGKIFKRSVEDAVRAAAPLPLPPDKSLFSQFREITFKFDPKE